jgi:hypothetical protein
MQKALLFLNEYFINQLERLIKIGPESVEKGPPLNAVPRIVTRHGKAPENPPMALYERLRKTPKTYSF